LIDFSAPQNGTISSCPSPSARTAFFHPRGNTLANPLKHASSTGSSFPADNPNPIQPHTQTAEGGWVKFASAQTLSTSWNKLLLHVTQNRYDQNQKNLHLQISQSLFTRRAVATNYLSMAHLQSFLTCDFVMPPQVPREGHTNVTNPSTSINSDAK